MSSWINFDRGSSCGCLPLSCETGFGRRSSIVLCFAAAFCLFVLLMKTSKESSVTDTRLTRDSRLWNGDLDQWEYLPYDDIQKRLEKDHQEHVEKAQRQGTDRAKSFLPPLPYFGEEVVFIGHTLPDMDSIASAVGGAYLWNGTAMYVNRLNPETLFLLDFWNVSAPKRAEDSYHGQPFVLVDHNSFSQRYKHLVKEKIMGIIDHHAVSNNPAYVPLPVFVDIRPWGSCSTIIATKFLEHHVNMPSHIAGLLLSGIISDTLNLQSPTSTVWDRKVLSWLSKLAIWKDPETERMTLGKDISAENLEKLVSATAKKQFYAKANITYMNPFDIVTTDFKRYKFDSADGSTLHVGWSTIETVEPFYSEYFEEHIQGLADAVSQLRKQYSLSFMFLSIVDIENAKSAVVCREHRSCALLEKSFKGLKPKQITNLIDGKVFSTSPRVSRKKDFIPPIRETIMVMNP